jgi:MFS family permease
MQVGLASTAAGSADGPVMCFFISVFTLASYATKGLGLSQTQGAITQSILAASLLVGRPLCGLCSDRFGRLLVPIVCYAVAGVNCFAVWLPARNFAVLSAFASIQGLVCGVVWSSSTPIIATVTMPIHVDQVVTVFWTSMALPALIAQPIAISLIDYSQTRLGRSGRDAYTISIALCGAMCFVASLLLFCARWQR